MWYVKYVFIILGALVFFFLNDTATPEISTLSLHDALPISMPMSSCRALGFMPRCGDPRRRERSRADRDWRRTSRRPPAPPRRVAARRHSRRARPASRPAEIGRAHV